MESCCGKDCLSCAQGPELGCAGCREGMGRPFTGPCEIAACCRERGHDFCATCTYINGCPRWAGREEVPERERRRQAEERARRERLAEQAPVLGKWLWWMFWLVVPRELASLMTMDRVVEILPGLDLAGALLTVLCGLACGWFLWKLGPVLRDYRTAALCQFVNVAASVAAQALGLRDAVALLPALGLIGLGMFRDYKVYHAHAQVLTGVDDALAEKWRRLWKYLIWILWGMGGALLLMIVSPLLGLLALVAATVALVAVAVTEMVYLWRTAKVFRGFCAPDGPEG